MQVQPDSSLFGPGGLEAEDSSPRETLRARVLDERERAGAFVNGFGDQSPRRTQGGRRAAPELPLPQGGDLKRDEKNYKNGQIA